jgi:hypothetical protein
VQLLSSLIEFAIVDRKELGEKFNRKVKMLDFTMNEIWDLGPFIKWAGLEDRYISRMVKKISLSGSRFSSQLFNGYGISGIKAHGLFRYRHPHPPLFSPPYCLVLS